MGDFQDLLNRFNNKDRDLITTLYEKGGDMFRDSVPGKIVKGVVTSDLVKKGRNKLLDMSGAPEHYKQFVKYLSGGTIGNKDITELPANARKDVIQAHLQKPTDTYPFSGYPDKDEFILAGKTKGQPNPSYDPNSTLLQTYDTSPETAYSLGNVQFKPNKDGGYTLTDIYDVDSNVSMGSAPYKPLRGTKADLQEGGQLASRLYDISKFFGLTGDMKYNVKFDPSEF
tara:strand:- start:243 stop:923 length:681 start_codon:yes stop_codon:yes gene_type:complete